MKKFNNLKNFNSFSSSSSTSGSSSSSTPSTNANSKAPPSLLEKELIKCKQTSSNQSSVIVNNSYVAEEQFRKPTNTSNINNRIVKVESNIDGKEEFDKIESNVNSVKTEHINEPDTDKSETDCEEGILDATTGELNVRKDHSDFEHNSSTKIGPKSNYFIHKNEMDTHFEHIRTEIHRNSRFDHNAQLLRSEYKIIDTSSSDAPMETGETGSDAAQERKFAQSRTTYGDSPLSQQTGYESRQLSPQDQFSDKEKSNSPIMLTTMQPVVEDYHSDNGLMSEANSMANIENGVAAHHMNESVMSSHIDDGVQHLNEGALERSNHLNEQAVNLHINERSNLGGRDILINSSQIREQIIEANNVLSTQHQHQHLQMNEPSLVSNNSLINGGQQQKTIIYLQSSTNEHGQPTFIYDPMQNPGLPTLPNGLPNGLNLQELNLSNSTGSATTVLVLQEMVQDGSSGVAGSVAAPPPPPAGVTLVNTVPSTGLPTAKIPAIIGFRKRKDNEEKSSLPLSSGTLRMAEIPTSEPGGGGSSSGTSGGAGGGGGGSSSTSTSAAEDPGWRAYYENQHPLSAATSAMLNINGDQEQTSSTMPPLIYEYYKIPQLEKEIWPSTSLNQQGHPTTTTTTNLLTTSPKMNTNLLNTMIDPSSSSSSQQSANIQDLQSLFLHQNAAAASALTIHPNIIKREPEDLSHRKNSSIGSLDLKKSKIVLVTPNQQQQQQDLVIDVVNNNNIKDEFSPHNRNGGTTPSSISSEHMSSSNMELINTDNIKHTSLYNTMTSSSPPINYNIEYSSSQNSSNAFSTSRNLSDQYYREYFNNTPSEYNTAQVRPAYVGDMESSIMERYVRSQAGNYHTKSVISASGLTVDLPSPDSGIGDTITPRDQTAIQSSFDYSDMCSPANLMNDSRVGVAASPGSTSNRSRPWHDFGRQNDADKIQIPKLFSSYGFKYHLETPISTNQRREDDRVTYINKGQFYGVTMEYVPDPETPLKSQTVKSIVMLMFREEKSPEDEIKAWQFWHSRQHSVKQRILDADTKNSVGLVGCIEEISHNAIAVYWNPLESPAKINIAVQCLSTDFSSQKGVKGLPLHLQIDTYDDPRDGPVLHRGYCQIKVFCDKGAERKTRDEERRAAKRKMTATGRKKMDELYHPPCERSEFYAMADTVKPPVLFSPAEDIEKLASMELGGFYGQDETSSLSNGEAGPLKHGGSPFLIHSKPPGTPTPQTLKFHNHFPPDSHSEKKDPIDSLTTDGNVFSTIPMKRPKLMPPINERVMLYVRQESDEIYTPLHVSPPTTQGLLNALESKYNINAANICNLLRKNLKGIIVKMDDAMLRFYCNEDLFLLEVEPATDKPDSELINIILVEIDS